MKLSTKIALGLFGVGIIAIVIDASVKEKAPGTVVIFAPLDAKASVTIDGRSLDADAGKYAQTVLKHGVHPVHVAAPEDRTALVTIDSGRDRIGVPIAEEQCFVELDVTLSHYGDTAGKVPPKVTQRFRYAEPFPVSHTYSLAEEELPKSTTDRVDSDGKIVGMQLVHLFRTVPCAILDDDARILEVLGYKWP